MICEACRDPHHTPDKCRDGAPPAGGYGAGRWCNCQHQKTEVITQEEDQRVS